jgi:spoIIIJ-associated protein
MQLDEKKKLIEETTRELLEKMGFQATIHIAMSASTSEEEVSEETPISVELQLTDSKYLIGKYGVNLSALQHILRVLVRNKTDERINFNVDVNNYREEQKQALVTLAHEMGDKVRKEKKSAMLRAMNAYERRIVHVELAKMEGIVTESVGEGEDRKVIIKPTSVGDEYGL